MNCIVKRILYFLLGVIGLLSVLCSIVYTGVTNEKLMLEGFQKFSQTEHLNVPASEYEKYAHLICIYLDGTQDFIMSMDAQTHETKNIFSDKENQHLADVKGLVTGLKIARYAGGGLVITVLGLLYFLRREDQRPQLLSDATRGFAIASITLLLISLGLLIWGLFDFTGLFWTFHKLAFSNDLWLLDPNTSLLVSLMPESFFSWYAVELLKSLWPVLGMMLLIPIVWLRLIKSQKEPKKT